MQFYKWFSAAASIAPYTFKLISLLFLSYHFVGDVRFDVDTRQRNDSPEECGWNAKMFFGNSHSLSTLIHGNAVICTHSRNSERSACCQPPPEMRNKRADVKASEEMTFEINHLMCAKINPINPIPIFR